MNNMLHLSKQVCNRKKTWGMEILDNNEKPIFVGTANKKTELEKMLLDNLPFEIDDKLIITFVKTLDDKNEALWSERTTIDQLDRSRHYSKEKKVKYFLTEAMWIIEESEKKYLNKGGL